MTTPTEAIARYLHDGSITYTKLADGSGVVLDIKGGKVLTLNGTGVFLIEAVMNGATDDETLAKTLAAEYHIDQDTAMHDTSDFLRALSKAAGIST